MDECVRWTSSELLGTRPRLILIGPDERLWVGGEVGEGEGGFHLLERETGSVEAMVTTIQIPEIAAFTPDGLLWIVGDDSILEVFDALTLEPSFEVATPECRGQRDLTTNLDGEVWLSCEDPPMGRVHRYDRETEVWESFELGGHPPRSVVADSSYGHDLYLVGSDAESWPDGESHLTYVRTSPFEIVGHWPIEGCLGATAVLFPIEGNPHVLCAGSNTVTTVSPDGTWSRSTPVGDEPTARSEYVDHQTVYPWYFDGFLEQSVTGEDICGEHGRARWISLQVDIITPENTVVLVWAQSSENREQLWASPEVLLWRGSELPPRIDLSAALAASGLADDLQTLEIAIELRAYHWWTTDSPSFRCFHLTASCR